MIREPATIVSVGRGEVWVHCDAQQACPRCAEGRGCGGGLLGGLLRARLRPVRAVGDADGLAAGDRVVIGLAETTLVRAAATMYLVPLGGIVLGALSARGVAGTGDVFAIVGGALGFVVALALVRRYGTRRDSDASFHPRILGRCERVEEGAPVALPLVSGD